MIKEKKNRYTCIHIVFVIIFKLILIYLLNMLLVFKIKGIFEKKINVVSFVYNIDKFCDGIYHLKKKTQTASHIWG